MPQKTKVHEHTTVDSDGEVISKQTVSAFPSNSEDRFTKLYLDDVLTFGLLTKCEIVVFLLLMRYMDYKNRIEVGINRKKSMAKKAGFSLGTVNNAIHGLSKKKFLIRVEIGTYLANPNFVGKGSWTAISELRTKLNLTIGFFKP